MATYRAVKAYTVNHSAYTRIECLAILTSEQREP